MDSSASPLDVRAQFAAAGQGHVFQFWDCLTPEQQRQLASQAAEIDLAEVDRLYQDLILGSGSEGLNLEGLEPAPYVPHPAKGGDTARWQAAYAKGEELLRAGQVAAFTVAGGQGTRLGYDGPKGTFPVTPVTHKTLFHVFAEKILAASARYGQPIPWLIMTSHINHEATVANFKENDFFGLPEGDVIFFSQGRMPAVDGQGKVMLEATDTLAMSPDGHGGSLRALVRSGAIAKLQARGVKVLSYFQVDNVLIQVIDPAFIGFHALAGAEMSSKMIPKRDAAEKVGIFCVQDGQTKVIEYSDMPAEMQAETDADGKLRFLAGSIAIHIFNVDFIDRVGKGGQYQLPFHRAHKKIATVDASGNAVKPEKPNGFKFEMFVFDALPFAANALTIETLREDDFSPVKNAEGSDSPQTARDDQLRQWTRWLKAAGVQIEADSSGLPSVTFEISPLYADSQAAFVARWKATADKPAIVEGTVLA